MVEAQIPGQEQADRLARQGRMEEALDWYDKALFSHPRNEAVLNNRTIALISLGRYEEALACSRTASSINPYSVDVWINMGIALDKLGRHPEAIDVLEQAVAISPYNAYARALLGIIYQKMEMDDKAEAQNRKLQEIVFPREYAGFYFATAVFMLGILLGGIRSVEGKPLEVTAVSQLLIIILFGILCSLYLRSLRFFQEINREVLTAPCPPAPVGDHAAGGVYVHLVLLFVVFLTGTVMGMTIWAHFS
jgi:tetratricopeptide (TPR) repeat protein